MRKKVFFAAVFLVTMLFAVAVGWTAVYYLSPSGSATPPYDTWEKAANNLNQILGLDLAGENTIYVAEATYSGSANYILLNEAKFANLSIIGRGNSNHIIFDPGTTYSCLINDTSITNVRFENLTIKGTGDDIVRVENGTDVNFIDCNIVGGKGHSRYSIRVANNSTVIVTRCTFWKEDYNYDGYALYVVGAASLRVNYSYFYSPNGSFGQFIYHNSTGNINVTNCIFAKSFRQGVTHVGSGNLTISNSIILGSVWRKHSTPTIYRGASAGTTLIKNSVILPSTYYPTKFYSTGVTTENVIEDDPFLEPFSARAIIIPRVDDNSNVEYAQSLASVLSEYGYKGSFFVHTNNLDIIDSLRILVQGGVMEIAPHTYSHTNLTYDHALHFEYSGSDANPTVELDSSRVIRLRTDGSDDVDIDTTQSNADTLGEIIDNFSGTNNWTISYSTTDGQDPDCIRASCKAESLAEMAATAAPCDIDFLKETDCDGGNCEGFYKTEIYEPKVDLTNAINSEGNIIDPQTGQVYEARTFVPPFGAGDNNVMEALRTSGYIGAAGIDAFSEETLPYNVFKLGAITVDNLIATGDEEQTTKNAELFAINAAINGLVVTVLAHDESQATMEEWRWILNGFKRAQKHYNIQVTSLQLAIEALKRLGTYDPSTGDVDIHWSMPLFRLRYDSPCIDAGVKIAGIHDQADWQDLGGNMIHYGRAPDIGAYEAVTDVATAWGMLPWYGRKYCVRW